MHWRPRCNADSRRLDLHVLITAAQLVMFAGACSGDQGGKSSSASSTTSASSATATTSGADLTGAGSTFAYPLYSKWAGDYATKVGVKINYQSIGSGGGIRQFAEQTVDFGGTDAPMIDEELAKAKGGAVLHVPTAMGADVVIYNLPGVTQPLKMTPDVIGVANGLPANTDYRISIINAPGHDAYPISSMTWIILYRKQTDAVKGKKLVDFLRWGLSDGQKLEPALDYAPLPDAILAPLRARVDSVTIAGAQ